MQREALTEFLDEARDRRDEVLCVAFEVFHEKGFAGATMLAIAQRAKASKETLYSWFGNKSGLFESLIRWRMERLAESLQISQDVSSPLEGLRVFSRHFLTMILLPSTIVVQRIAIGEACANPQLGQILAEAGKQASEQAALYWLLQLKQIGILSFDDPALVTETYLSLLMGQWNYIMLMGQMPPPSEAEIEARVDHAIEVLRKVWGRVHT
jgi:AcrR family transcriptional regulator